MNEQELEEWKEAIKAGNVAKFNLGATPEATTTIEYDSDKLKMWWSCLQPDGSCNDYQYPQTQNNTNAW